MRARRWIVLGAIVVVVIVGVVIAGGLVYQPTVPAVNRTYTATDLTLVLGKVKAASGTKGDLYDEGTLLGLSPDNGLSAVIDEFLAKKGVTLIPAKCRALLASLPMTNPQVAETTTRLSRNSTWAIRRSCRWRRCPRARCQRLSGHTSSRNLLL